MVVSRHSAIAYLSMLSGSTSRQQQGSRTALPQPSPEGPLCIKPGKITRTMAWARQGNFLWHRGGGRLSAALIQSARKSVWRNDPRQAAATWSSNSTVKHQPGALCARLPPPCSLRSGWALSTCAVTANRISAQPPESNASALSGCCDGKGFSASRTEGPRQRQAAVTGDASLCLKSLYCL